MNIEKYILSPNKQDILIGFGLLNNLPIGIHARWNLLRKYGYKQTNLGNYKKTNIRRFEYKNKKFIPSC
jgi:hypothetical protein